MTDSPASSPAAQTAVWNILRGPYRYAALLAFTQLGCADRLAEGPASTDVLARSCDADPSALGRVLRCCASLGIVSPVSDGGWELTDAGLTLGRDGPMRAAVLHHTGQEPWLAMLALVDAVRTGQPVFERIAGQDFYAWHVAHPEQNEVFQQFMADRSATAGAVAAGLDFTGAATVADIGGGYGTILAAVLNAHACLRGILLDRPDVLPGAEAYLAKRGLGDRCTLLAGDYFDPGSIPPADVYILGNILHNHTDAEARRILANLLAARPAARLLLAEILLPDDPRVEDIGIDMDIRRLAVGGRERTRAEWVALLGAARLTITATVPTGSPLTIIDASPAAG